MLGQGWHSFWMGGGCFHHLTHLNVGSLSSASLISVSRVTAQLLCVLMWLCLTRVERKEGHPAQSVQVPALPRGVVCGVLAPDTGRSPSVLPSPTVLWQGRACITQGFSRSLLIMAFCKCPMVFLSLNRVFLCFPICTLI